MNLSYQIEFFSYWHSSSGLAAGTASNLTTLKDEQQLPIVRGRTLKGMLRDAAENLQSLSEQSPLISQAFIDQVFGKPRDEDKGEIGVLSDCFFSDALLSKTVAEKASKEKLQSHFYTTLHSTAIEDSGLAKQKSLRSLEVCIPVTLYAEIQNFPEEYKDMMKHCFDWVKRMGLNRHRGLGRCKFSKLN